MNLAEIRAGVQDLQAKMESDPDCYKPREPEHMFAHGLYGRKIILNAGEYMVGKIHRHSCITFVMRGSIISTTDDEPILIQAPYAFVSPAGTKRAVLALQETEWMTVQASTNTDLDELEKELIVDSFEALA